MKKRFLLWENPCIAVYALVGVLLLVGGINVFSASFVKAQGMFGDGLYFLLLYYVYALLGIVAIAIIRYFGYKFWLNKKLLYLALAVVLGMLIAVEFVGEVNNGAARWLKIGPLKLQPSEIAKPLLIMIAAKYLGNVMKRGERLSQRLGDCLCVIIPTLIIGFLVYKQPDMGTAAIIVALVMGLFVVAGLPMLWVTGMGILGVVGGGILAFSSEYRAHRFMVWLDPWLDAQGRGYQTIQSLKAIGSGGLTGTGWGHGAAKFAFLPESHTDFAFAIFCQENGLIGAFLLILVFCLLCAAFCKIAFHTRDKVGFLLAVGVTFLIIGQAFSNMAMVCGLLPVIGVPLTFISYGGTSMVISMAAIGLLLSVYDEEERLQKLEAEPPEKRRSDLRVVHSGRWQR